MNNILSNTRIILATPRGFCAGVERAVEILDKAIKSFGSPIYVKHEVVHNKFIIANFKDRGVIFIENINEVPRNSILIYSAHGVSMQVKEIAKSKNLKIFDATCPLVTKVHIEVHKFAKLGVDVVLIGHNGHPEIEGTMGQYKSDTGKIHLVENIKDVEKINITNPNLAYVTQTTLSIDDTKKIIEVLIKKYPKIKGPAKDDICYATQNRQDAVKSILNYCDYLLVIGSQNSSNSKRLTELAIKNDIPSMLVDDKNDINLKTLEDKKVIGVTAGASAPKILFDDLLKYLTDNGAVIEDFGQQIVKEDIVFSIPKEFRNL
mgnify:CR=1 FL=1|tara:strand:+ start:2204 stop:3160 length:957 start_codon:yes stop_codon:yes gene_type:complete